MHPTKSPFALVEGNAALNQPGIEPLFFEFSLTPRARKESSLIDLTVELNLDKARDLGLVKNHADEGSESTGWTIAVAMPELLRL